MQSSKTVSFARRLRVLESVLVFAASVLSLTAATTAFGQSDQPAQSVQTSQPAQPSLQIRQGQLYAPVPAVAPDLAQIVFFRTASSQPSAKDAAHVYVNSQLEGAIMPDGYTRFCVEKGTYSVEAYLGDAPLYAGKHNPKTEIDLGGGRTYFVGVSENGAGEPVPYRRADAERLLKTSREQINIINRSKAVVPCVNLPEPAKKVASVQTLLTFQLDAAVLFDFATTDSSAITPAGHAELRRIAAKIRELPRDSVKRIRVQGHADPIGSATTNLKLSKERARTVSHVLGQEGIPVRLIYAEGLGSTDLVVHCTPTGDLAKRIRCNAPNRRVEIHVEGIRQDNDESNQ